MQQRTQSNAQNLKCPQCQKPLALPSKVEKKVRITCPKCRYRFEITLENPLTSQWKKDNSMSENMKSSMSVLSQIPTKGKVVLSIMGVLLIALAGFLVYLLIKFIPWIIMKVGQWL